MGPVMGVLSWPALSETTKAPSNKSSSDSLKSLGDVASSSSSIPVSQNGGETLLASEEEKIMREYSHREFHEVEEVLELLKSTWRVLGITETIHFTCYALVLFWQYVITSERGLLRHAI